MTFQTKDTQISDTGKKLKGFDFSKPTTKGNYDDDRNADFDGLNINFQSSD